MGKAHFNKNTYQSGILGSWISDQLLHKKLKSIPLIIFLCLSIIAVTYVISTTAGPLQFVIPAVIIGVSVILATLAEPRFGFYLAICWSYFLFYFERLFISVENLPLGSSIDILMLVTLVAVLIKKLIYKDKKWPSVKNPITYAYAFYLLFLALELFNPYMHSFAGWAFIYWKLVVIFLSYFLALEFFDSLKSIKFFFKFWILFSLIAALYGCFQQWHGLLPFELNWVNADPVKFGLYFINGNYRKFSILSDPTAYAILMAVTALFCMVIIVHNKLTIYKKLFLFFIIIFLLMGMSYSGTRTATAMIPCGLLIYGLMSINNKKTLLFLSIFIVIGGGLVFGPIYGNQTINRIRSTFKGSGDASMNVRDVNRHFIQPYIFSHPLGGGVATSGVIGEKYNPGHILAGFPPDSGYLRSAIETGWIGLAINLIVYFIILKFGVNVYYKSENPEIKGYAIAIVTTLYALYIASFTQEAVGQIPGALIYYPSLAALIRLKAIDDEQSAKNLSLQPK